MMTNASSRTTAHGSTRNDQFIAFVGSLATDTGNRARLRRSIRTDATITDDAWWLLGAWLPDSLDDALILARVAAWAATAHNTKSEPKRTIATELGDHSNHFIEETARRVLEGITREGATTDSRLSHITRTLQQCRNVRIDWARMISDLTGLTRGGQWAHSVRSRWYRDYFVASTPKSVTDDNNDNPTERKQQ